MVHVGPITPITLRLDQGAGGVTTSPTLLGPVMAWSQQNYLKILLIVRCFGSCWGCRPRDPQRFRKG